MMRRSARSGNSRCQFEYCRNFPHNFIFAEGSGDDCRTQPKTPHRSDPGSRIGAALAAAKTAFVGYLTVRGMERLITQYDIRIIHGTYWS
jgi:hypothetical protein